MCLETVGFHWRRGRCGFGVLFLLFYLVLFGFISLNWDNAQKVDNSESFIIFRNLYLWPGPGILLDTSRL